MHDEVLVEVEGDFLDSGQGQHPLGAKAVDQEYGLALDVSANRTILELQGPQARAVLGKGCPLDVHPRK